MRKILEIYKGLSKPTKASIWYIVSNVLLKGISFFTLPIFSHLLSTSEYGVVSVYSSWVSTIAIISTLTIWGGVFNVGMVKFSDDSSKMISAFQGLASSITMTLFLVSFLFLDKISLLLGMPPILVICMFLEILVQIPFNIWSTEQRYKFKYKQLVFITCIIAIISPLLGVLCVKYSAYKAEARIISNLAINVIIGIILFISIQKKGKKFFSKKYWGFGFKFNIVLVPHYLSTQILNQADRIMINSMCGSSDAGIYSVAYNFAFLLSLITNGINSSLTPYIYQCMKNGNTKKMKKETTSIILLVAILAVVLICFIPDLFKLMLPKSYLPALKVIPPITVGAFFLFLYPLFGSIEFYYEENKYVTYASVIGAGMNIILNYIFIKLCGFIAAAYTTLFCYFGFSICHYVFMMKILKKNKQKNSIYDIKSISIISICLICISLIMVALYEHTYIRWGIIILVLFGLLIKKQQIFALLKELKRR